MWRQRLGEAGGSAKVEMDGPRCQTNETHSTTEYLGNEGWPKGKGSPKIHVDKDVRRVPGGGLEGKSFRQRRVEVLAGTTSAQSMEREHP